MDQQTRIDEFGVDHSNFSLCDEIEYNFRRAKEKEMKQSLMPNAYNNDYLGRMKDEELVRSQQCTELNNINHYSLQPTNNTFPPPFSPGQIAWSGVKGMAQGISGSLERSLNTATGGLYDLALDHFGNNGYERRQKELENLAAQENLQKPLKYLNYFNDAVTGSYGAAKLKQLGKIPEYIYSLYKNMR